MLFPSSQNGSLGHNPWLHGSSSPAVSEGFGSRHWQSYDKKKERETWNINSELNKDETEGYSLCLKLTWQYWFQLETVCGAQQSPPSQLHPSVLLISSQYLSPCQYGTAQALLSNAAANLVNLAWMFEDKSFVAPIQSISKLLKIKSKSNLKILWFSNDTNLKTTYCEKWLQLHM